MGFVDVSRGRVKREFTSQIVADTDEDSSSDSDQDIYYDMNNDQVGVEYSSEDEEEDDASVIYGDNSSDEGDY